MARCTCAVARAACVHTAAGCAAAAAEPVRIVGSALPRRSHSTAQSIDRRCRGRPRTSTDLALPGSAHAHGALGVPRRAAGGSRSGPFSRPDPIRTIPIVTHTRMPAAAVVLAQSSVGQPNERSRTSIQLTGLSGPHIGRQGPLCATVTCEDLDALTVGIRWVRGHFFVRTADWYRCSAHARLRWHGSVASAPYAQLP